MLGRSRNKKPLKIGVSPRLFHPLPGATGLQSKPLMYLEQSVAHWVMSRDVMVFMIPTIANNALLSRSNIRLSDYAGQLDGLVLQGGADLSPSSYGEEPLKPEWLGDKVRDDYELELLMEFVEAHKPVLGICRGAQLINVAFGGTLYQDIPSQHPDAATHVDENLYEHLHHEIRFEKGSRLARLYPDLPPEAPLRVNSIHHQAARSLGKDVVVEAWSVPDNIPEAIRANVDSYVFGVQWHPEFLRPDDASVLNCAPILEDFLAAVRKQA
jgi:putative glutamine amidotransferase